MYRDLSRVECLVDLPCEILDRIFSHISRKDVKQLSLVSRKFRSRTTYYLFESLQGTWADLINSGNSEAKKHFSQAKKFRITLPESKFEYHTNALQTVTDSSLFPNLHKISVNTESLSFWLKNHGCNNVTHLLLYQEGLKRSQEKMFHLCHLDRFTSIQTLYLQGYNFQWGQGEEVVLLARLRKLTLENCTWEFPFDLASFNQFDTLQTLNIIYTNNNTFVLLERYSSYLRNPFPRHLSSLKFITFSFVNSHLFNGHLTPTVLYSFLECFSGLRELRLCGWVTTLQDLRHVLIPRVYEDPFKLYLEIDDPEPREILAFRKLVQRPNLEIIVKATPGFEEE